MEKIVKSNPYEDNYFDDTERLDELKTEVYYDTRIKIRGFHKKRRTKCRNKAEKA